MAQAANGVDVNSGSNLNVQVSQREAGQTDAATTMHNALLQAYGYRVTAQSDEAQAQLDQTEAIEAPIGGALNATGGLLSSASSISSKWATPAA